MSKFNIGDRVVPKSGKPDLVGTILGNPISNRVLVDWHNAEYSVQTSFEDALELYEVKSEGIDILRHPFVRELIIDSEIVEMGYGHKVVEVTTSEGGFLIKEITLEDAKIIEESIQRYKRNSIEAMAARAKYLAP